MNKTLTILGASAIALGLLAGNAQAKKVFYEVNGQRYSYETTDPDQVAAARKRIEAANAADAAKAKAEAERASNPLAAVFGSPAQQEAVDTKARLDQLIAEQDKAAAAKPQRIVRTPKEEPAKKRAEDQSPAPQEEQATASDEQSPADVEPAKTASADTTSAPASPEPAPKPAVKSLSFDGETGIKTIIMTDGSIHEEPFDVGILSSLASERADAGSVTAYLNGFRRTAPGDITGSTTPSAAPAAAKRDVSPTAGKPTE
jgi:FtsZ-interacting cell division protein ZipA